MPSSQPLIGNLPYFSGIGLAEWKTYVERMDLYFLANNIIENERQIALLVITLNEDFYKRLRDRCYPKLPKEKNYHELIGILSELINKEIQPYRERIKFHKAKQEENETVPEWFDRIKKLSIHCFFHGDLNLFLFDKFITGLRSDLLLNRFYEERGYGVYRITLDQAIKIATTLEKSIQANEKNV